MNPFFSPYPTPHGTVPFNSISLSDIEEAVMQGMVQHEQEIEALVSNSSSPSYSNTIEVLERSGSLLDRSTTVLFNLLSAETNDELDALSERLSPLLSAHSNKILHNVPLFARIKTVYDHYHSDDEQLKSLSREQVMLLDNTYDTFIRCGSNLNDTDKQRFTELSQELSLLELKFSQNHLKDMNDYTLTITDDSELKGLPETVLESAREESESRGLNGWTFTLHAPCYGPFLTYCQNRELRRELYMAYNTLCTHENAYNNLSIAGEIVNKKRELAQLLNYDCYADYVLIKRMAEKKDRVYQLFDNLISAYMPIAQEEVKAVESLAREYEGDSFELMPWDFSYYSNKLKERKFNINSEMVRPYLPLEKVKEGIFGLAGDLYGLQFVRNN